MSEFSTDIGTYTIDGFTVIGFRKMHKNANLINIVYKHMGIENTGTMWVNQSSPNFNKIFYSGEVYKTKIECKMYYINDYPEQIIHSFICPDKLLFSRKTEDVGNYFYLFEEKSVEELKEMKNSDKIYRTKINIFTIFCEKTNETWMGFKDIFGENGDVFLIFNKEYFKNKRIETNKLVECLVEVYTSYERDAETKFYGIDLIKLPEFPTYEC